MNTYVVIFRRQGQPLPHVETQRLNEETASWAKIQNNAGHKLEPRILSAQNAFRGPNEASVQSNIWTLSALLFLEASDFNAATQIAESHPGLHYGFNVEVRPWAKPGTPVAR
jgi:hypothetical protein